MRFGFWFLFLGILVLEGTVTTIPLVFIFMLCLTVIKKAEWLFPLALFSGIILDILTVRTIGLTSTILIISIFLILLYERKYEIDTIPFVFFASFLGSFIFMQLVGHPSIIEPFISSVLAVGGFVGYQFFKKNSSSSTPRLQESIKTIYENWISIY